MNTTKGCLDHYFVSEDNIEENKDTEELLENQEILNYLMVEGVITEEDLLDEDLVEEILLDEGIRSKARIIGGAAAGYTASTVGIMMKMRGYKKKIKYLQKQMADAAPARKASLQKQIDTVKTSMDRLQMQKGKIKAAATVAGGVAGKVTSKTRIKKLQDKLTKLTTKKASKEEIQKVKDQIKAAR